MRRTSGSLGAISTATGSGPSSSRRRRRRSPLLLAVGALLGTLLVVVIPPPAPAAAAGLAVDRVVSVNTKGTATTAAFSTTQAGELLVAFVSADGPGGGGQTHACRAAGSRGAWCVTPPPTGHGGGVAGPGAGVLTGVTVQSVEAKSGYDQSLTVVAFTGASGIGSSTGAGLHVGVASWRSPPPPNSLVYGVGNDWDSATARAWAVASRWCTSGATRPAVTTSGWSSSPIRCWHRRASPSARRCRRGSMEPLGGGDRAVGAARHEAPSAPGALTATGGQASATLSWGAATDDVAVTGYDVYRSTTTGFTPGAGQPGRPALRHDVRRLRSRRRHVLLPGGGPGRGRQPRTPVERGQRHGDGPAAPTAATAGPDRRQGRVGGREGNCHRAAVSTAQAGELVLAFVSSDGPSGGGQTTTVSGGGLAWSLVRRTATQPGTTEVWKATAAAVLNGAIDPVGAVVRRLRPAPHGGRLHRCGGPAPAPAPRATRPVPRWH